MMIPINVCNENNLGRIYLPVNSISRLNILIILLLFLMTKISIEGQLLSVITVFSLTILIYLPIL